MKKFCFSATCLLFSLYAAVTHASVAFDALVPEGGFVVEVAQADEWAPLGSPAYDLHFSEERLPLNLSNLRGDAPVRVRISRGPEGMANLDSVHLIVDGREYPALSATERANGMDFTHKLRTTDFDVINAQGRILELAFAPIVGEYNTAELRIVGREDDPAELPGGPCAYPSGLHPMDGGTEAYHYALDSNPGEILVDGEIMPEEGWGKPLFLSFTEPVTGHPDGMTYGFFKNDDRFLYAAIDFTSDNTFDGNEDFAALLIRTDEGWKRFDITVSEREWGRTGFTSTDKVAYQHKVYEFAIPLDELGMDAESGQEIEFTVLAYGTVGCDPVMDIEEALERPDPLLQFLSDTALEVEMLHLRLFHGGNRETDPIWIESITATGSGSGDESEDISEARLYWDANTNGLVDNSDVELASGTFDTDNGTVFFDLSVQNHVIDSFEKEQLLIVYDIDPLSPNNSTFQTSIAEATDVVIAAGSPCPTTPSLSALYPPEGGTLTVIYDGTATAEAGAKNPSAGFVAAGQTDEPMLQLAVTADAVEPLRLETLTVTDPAASLNPSAIENVRLWVDVDASGTVTSGDIQLGSDAIFTEGSSTLPLTSTSGGVIPAGEERQFLVTYSFAADAVSQGDHLKMLSDRLASIARTALATPFALAGCGGGGTLPLLTDLPEGFVFTDKNGYAITEAKAGTIVQVRTLSGLLILQFIMGENSISLDGASFARNDLGTLIALAAGGNISLSLKGSSKAVAGLPSEITAFIPCGDDDTSVAICPDQTETPTNLLLCSGLSLLTEQAPTAGGLTWANLDRTGSEDCQVTGDRSLFDTFYGAGVFSQTFQASVTAETDLKLRGKTSDHTINPEMLSISGGTKTLIRK